MEVFANRHGIKPATVKDWLAKGYIPGAIQDNEGNYLIPDNARCPYTKARAKKEGVSLFKSIVKAYSCGFNVVPQLYDITPEKLNAIITTLKDNGLITEEHLDGLVYYNATPEGENYISLTNSEAYKIISDCVSKLAPTISSIVLQILK